MATNEATILQMTQQLVKLRKQAKQLKRKLKAKRSDIFSMIAEQKIRDMEHSIAGGREQNEMLAVVLEMVDDYEPDVPPPPQRPWQTIDEGSLWHSSYDLAARPRGRRFP